MNTVTLEDHTKSQFEGLSQEDAMTLLEQLNGTVPEEYICQLMDQTKHNRTPGWCGASFDGLMCWISSPPDTFAVRPCMRILNGIEYNTTRKYYHKLFFLY